MTHVYEFRRASLEVHLANRGVFYVIKGDASLIDLVEREVAASELSLHMGTGHEDAYRRLWEKAPPCKIALKRPQEAVAT